MLPSASLRMKPLPLPILISTPSCASNTSAVALVSFGLYSYDGKLGAVIVILSYLDCLIRFSICKKFGSFSTRLKIPPCLLFPTVISSPSVVTLYTLLILPTTSDRQTSSKYAGTWSGNFCPVNPGNILFRGGSSPCLAGLP